MTAADLSGISLHFVDTVEDAAAFLTWLRRPRRLISTDTETLGLKWWEPDFTRLVQFGDTQTGWALSVRHWRAVIEQALNFLARSGAKVAFHNVKFDMHALESDGFPVPLWHNVHDTASMHRLTDPLAAHGLKPIARSLYGDRAVAGQDMLKAEFAARKCSWHNVPVDLPAYWAYAAMDTVLTARVAEHLWPSVPQAPYDTVMAVQAIMYRAETRGMRIDRAYTAGLRDAWALEAEALRTDLEAHGIKNPSSNPQVTATLKALGWEPDEFTDTGLPKLDKAILAGLTAAYGDLAPAVLRYRRVLKWSSTYLTTFLDDADATGHVHASINVAQARTGRDSITGPPLQTLPKGPDIKNCVIPQDGFDLWSTDYDGMEYRLFASYAGDPDLTAAAASEDLHTACAALAYGVASDAVTKEQRDRAKNTNFARLYGAGAEKIAATAGVSTAEIEDYINRFDSRFPQAKRFMDHVIETGRTRLANEGQAYVRTASDRYLPSPPTKVYKLLNYLIQGGCADVFKEKIIALDAAGLSDNIIVPVHDELLFQFPSGPEGVEMSATAAATMQELTRFAVPLTCSTTGPLQRWGDKYATKGTL